MAIIFRNIMGKSYIYRVDQFGVKNYSMLAMAAFSIVSMLLLVTILGYITYTNELGHADSNIGSYSDAVWLMLMSASTIGFGDHYPVTLAGRITVMVMFTLGVGILGSLGALFATKMFGFSDTNVKNRELRKQNDEILQKLVDLEAKIDAMSNNKES